jgi:hypothetical protein
MKVKDLIKDYTYKYSDKFQDIVPDVTIVMLINEQSKHVNFSKSVDSIRTQKLNNFELIIIHDEINSILDHKKLSFKGQ